MTAPRLARAGRSRFFVVLAVFAVLMVGSVMFHSLRQQLDDTKQLRSRCEQQQDALNSRMQAIVEHKFRLEKSLENERKEHRETKEQFEQRVKAQKSIHSKTELESSARFDSLQQHFKLLESEHKDLVEECAKAKENQLEEINGLERKVKLLQSQLQQEKNKRTSEETINEQWKMKYMELEKEKEKAEKLLEKTSNNDITIVDIYKNKIKELEKVIEEYKNHCSYRTPQLDTESNDKYNADSQLKPAVEKSFSEQIAVSDGLYKIQINIRNNTLVNNFNKAMVNGASENNGNSMIGVGKELVINSVENFQMIPKPIISNGDQNISNNEQNKEVLPQPPELPNLQKSSTPSTNSNKRAMRKASPLQPTSEKYKRSSTQANNAKKELFGRLKPKVLPSGVAPVPDNFYDLLKNDEHPGDNNNNDNNNNNNNNNNRYANVVSELSGKRADPELENAANEVKDNDFNIADNKKDNADDHHKEIEHMNDAAEEDTNNFFESKLEKVANKLEDDDEGEAGGNKQGKGDSLLLEDDKLMNEVVRDQGKEPAFADGMPLGDEQEEEEDDDYLNPAERLQNGAAVRN